MLLRRKLTVLLMTVMLLVVSAAPALAPATSRTGHSPPSRLDMLTGSNRHRPRSPRLAEATESSTATHRTGTNLKSASRAELIYRLRPFYLPLFTKCLVKKYELSEVRIQHPE
jgi:hypothetical protein